nr:hypothetical protein [Tanacetum cinerariifolium]
STPIDTKKPLLKDPDGEDVDVHTYRSMIGSLMYLTSSRPDIMFAVYACARFQVTPKALHLHAVKMIFRYLKGKPHMGLWYPKDSPFDLAAYSDSDYAGQTVVVTSSTEAEYVAVASCCTQVLWIQNQLLDYGYNFMHTIIYIDNSGVNTPRSDEDRLELIELTIFLLPSDEKVGVEVSAVDLQVFAVRLILLFSIKYALTVNPNLYVSCIKQFWTSVAVKKVNDVIRLQTLVDKKKLVITEASIRDALHLDDAEGIECLPNEEIFAELARMGYEKPSTKLTFYKAFFSSQKQVGDLSTHTTKYTSPALTQIVFANMRRVGKGFSGVETPLFEGMIVEQQVAEGDDDEVHVKDVNAAGVATEGVVSAADDVVPTVVEELSIPSPTPPTLPSQPSHDIPLTSQDVVLEDAKDVAADAKDGQDADIDENADIQGRTAKSQAQIYKIDLGHANKVLSMQDEEESEPAKLQEVVDVVTTTKIITEVVTAASTTITATDVPISAATTVGAPTLTAAPSRRRKGVVIKDPKESATPSTIIHSEAKSKDKGKGILRKQKEDKSVKRYQALKRKPQTEAQARKNMMVYLKNVVGFKINYFKRMSYDDIRLIFEKHFDSNVAFLQKYKEQMDEEDSRALKRLNESQKEKAAKKQKLEEEERFATTKPKNFFDDFLLITLRAMFDKPDIHA